MSTTLTTEKILTHPKAFGLTTATNVQRALCRVMDGLPLAELASCEDVREAFGNTDTLPTVPPKEVHILAAIRSAKSLLIAAKMLQVSQSVRCENLSTGDIVRIVLVSLKLELTKAVMSHLVENGLAKPLLRPLFIGEPTYAGAVLRHPSGRPIEVVPQPLDRAGGSFASTWLAMLAFDEEPRMVGADGGVANWDHARDVGHGRILDGGILLGAGAPWAPFGPIYNLVQEHFGKPSADMVIARARGPQMNPVWWTPERCDDLLRRNPVAYRTDVLGEFADFEEGLTTAIELDAVTRKSATEQAPVAGGVYVAAIDPAGKRNAFTATIGRRLKRKDGSIYLRVVMVREWVPRAGRLDIEDIFRKLARICEPYGITKVHTDQFSVDSNIALGRRYGLKLVETTIGAANKFEMFDELRSAIAGERIELPPDPVLRADLLSVRKRVTQTGVAIHLPTTSDGRHADYASCVALLNYAALRYREPRPYVPNPKTEPHDGGPLNDGFDFREAMNDGFSLYGEYGSGAPLSRQLARSIPAPQNAAPPSVPSESPIAFQHEGSTATDLPDLARDLANEFFK